VLGARWGALVFALDLLKGLAAVLASRMLAVEALPSGPADSGSLLSFALLGGVAAIVGHVFTPWLRFQGGRGVATSLGVFLGIVPWPTLLAFLLWAVLFAVSKRVSVGSIGAATVYPFLVWLLAGEESRVIVTVVTAAVAALVLVRHIPNIRRLLSGTEPPTIPARAPKAERT
jgi:glycerol-3-phosphate acyltransferase PlsY